MLSDFAIEEVLKEIGQEGVLNSLNKMKSNQNDDFKFFFKKPSKNSFTNLLYRYLNEESLLTEEEIEMIKTEFKKQETEESLIPLKNLDIEVIKDKLPEAKREILNTNNINMFIDNENEIFASKRMINFIEWYTNERKNVYLMRSLENFEITETISIENLSKFIFIKAQNFNCDEEEDWLKDYYTPYVLERILFELDRLDVERVSIPLLISSSIYKDFVAQNRYGNKDVIVSTVRAEYNQFNRLMAEGGLKRIAQQYRYKFVDAFLELLNDHVDTKDGKITFIGFARFLFSLKYIDRFPYAIKFLFNVIDIDGDGILNRDDMYYFYKAQMNESNDPHVNPPFNVFYSRIADTCGSKIDNLNVDAVIKSCDASKIILMLIENFTFDDMFFSFDDSV